MAGRLSAMERRIITAILSPNQVNNLIGFPYIFRGALDVRAKIINEEMKVAAANAIASLARERVPDEVAAAMGGDRRKYGKNYTFGVKDQDFGKVRAFL